MLALCVVYFSMHAIFHKKKRTESQERNLALGKHQCYTVRKLEWVCALPTCKVLGLGQHNVIWTLATLHPLNVFVLMVSWGVWVRPLLELSAQYFLFFSDRKELIISHVQLLQGSSHDCCQKCLPMEEIYRRLENIHNLLYIMWKITSKHSLSLTCVS